MAAVSNDGFWCRTATIGASGPLGARFLAVNAEARRGESMNARIRDAQLQKIPYMLVVGDREEERTSP